MPFITIIFLTLMCNRMNQVWNSQHETMGTQHTTTLPFRSRPTQSPNSSVGIILAITSIKATAIPQRQKHTPQITYRGLDYPRDHVSEGTLRARLQVLLPLEQAVISTHSKSHAYRREFYAHCLDSFIPVSENGSDVFLKKNHVNVYLGVKRDSQNDCDGCLLKSAILYRDTKKPIRKFVGNREVFDIVTNDNGNPVIPFPL